MCASRMSMWQMHLERKRRVRAETGPGTNQIFWEVFFHLIPTGTAEKRHLSTFGYSAEDVSEESECADEGPVRPSRNASTYNMATGTPISA
jgi:hypothetical protein